jgi:hypothetical protein
MESLQARAGELERPLIQLPHGCTQSATVDIAVSAKRRPGRPPTYANLFERLRANCEPNEFTGCWEWTGHLDRYGYPRCTLRQANDIPRGFFAHRLMLELAYGYYFPFDEAGHNCNNPACIHPVHLEIQTKALNLSERRGYLPLKPGASWIPVLYPIPDWTPHPVIMQLLAQNNPTECPF